MVSNARLDLPLPLGPVTTVNFPSGRSTSTPLRLFWRAPRISMKSFAVGTFRRSTLAVFEPTGNIRCQSNGSQISVAAVLCEAANAELTRATSPAGRRLQFKPLGELFALLLQVFRHDAAEQVEKRLVLGEFLLPFPGIDPEKVGDACVIDVETIQVEIIRSG
jgi:hypothetical protein